MNVTITQLDYVNAHLRTVIRQQFTTPQDIANAVSFLTGEGAGFVSGQVLYVAGGPKS
jgi:3-oxoacyl-[acyl-carrier protein] reductase